MMKAFVFGAGSPCPARAGFEERRTPPFLMKLEHLPVKIGPSNHAEPGIGIGVLHRSTLLPGEVH